MNKKQVKATDIITTDKIRRTSNNISKINTSLADIAGINANQQEADIHNDKLLILDASSSMDMRIGSVTKWEHLIHAIEIHFLGSNANCLVFSSSMSTKLLAPEDISGHYPGGSTAMDEPFIAAYDKKLQDGTIISEFESIILISDGQPDGGLDGQEDVINIALKIKKPVNCIYIGDDNEAGAIFMKKLSKLTNGSSDVVKDNPDDIKLLKTKLAGLLGTGKAIEL